MITTWKDTAWLGEQKRLPVPVALRTVIDNKTLLEKVENGDCKAELLEKVKRNGQKTCNCIQCGKSFTRKSSLIVHQRIHTGEKCFMCTQCGKRFSLKSSMVRHLRIHIPKTGNTCPDCGKSFTRYSSLYQHQKVHNRQRQYPCCDCGKSFANTSQLVIHQKFHERKVKEEKSSHTLHHVTILHKAEDANACGRSFPKNNLLMRHQRKHIAKPLFPAVGIYELTNGNSISRRSDSDKSLQLDRTNISDRSENQYNSAEGRVNSIERRVLCAECGKSFTRKSSLIVHQRVHTGEKRFMCTQCGKRFGLKSSLVRHVRTHSPKILNICPDCGKCFSRYPSLFQHQKVHRRQKTFQCPECEKNFCGASQLMAHQRIHTGLWTLWQPDSGLDSNNRDRPTNNTHSAEESHMSQACSDSLQEQSLLQEHQSTRQGKSFISTFVDPRTRSSVCETGQKYDECRVPQQKDTCSKSPLHLVEKHSTYIGDKADRKVRSSKKHFLCAECGKSFTRKSSLIVHQRVHTGEKRFICTQCGKRFSLKSSMVRHLRIHVPKTGNICPDCGKSFTRYSSLYQHQKVNGRGKSYKCCQCEKIFCRTSQLVGHLRTHTTGKSNLKEEDKGNSCVINSSAGESNVNLLCGHQDLLMRDQIVQTASGTLPSNKMHKEHQENIDIQGCVSKDDYKTFSEESSHIHRNCNARDIHSKNSSGVERGGCTEAIISNLKGGSPSREKPYHCIECGKYFTRKSSLIVHQRVHTGEKLYVCTQCGRRFAFKSSLVRHMRTHTGKPLHMCSQCSIYFSCYQDLSVHMEIHESPLSCNAVLKLEPDEQQWLPDIKPSLGADKTEVSVLLMNEPEPSLLHRAQEEHEHQHLLPGASPSQCTASTCANAMETTQGDSRTMKKQKALDNTCITDEHLKNRTNVEMVTYPCSLDWGDDCHISNALNKDSSEKIEKIESPSAKPTLKHPAYCTLGFNALNRGSDEDNRGLCGEKHFLCAECGKSFTRKSSLIVHQRVHTGEKRFMCTQCGKMFGLKSSMVRHMRTHSS